MESKIIIFRDVMRINDFIMSHPLFNEAIIKHCELVIAELNSKKNIYKFFSRNNRFLVLNVVVSLFYINENVSFSDVKLECLRSGAISINTISSILHMLRATGMICTAPNSSDKRKLRYVVTKKGSNEYIGFINTLTPAIKIISGGNDSSISLTSDDLPSFISNYHRIYISGLFPVNFTDEVDAFITKDSGYMVLVRLYQLSQGLLGGDGRLVLKSIASECGVSVTHLKNILKEAQTKGLVIYDSNSGSIEILPAFISSFHSYISLFLSFIYYGLYGHLKI